MLKPLLVAALVALASPAFAQSVALKGPDGQSLVLDAPALAALPRAKVSFTGHGQTHAYEGPLLIEVLAKVGAPTGKALHGAALANAVLVSASDGYQVVFGLGELDPETRPNRVILADRADGAPLGAQDGPFKLVVEGDLRPARGVRMVTSIEIRPLGAKTPAPEHAH